MKNLQKFSLLILIVICLFSSTQAQTPLYFKDGGATGNQGPGFGGSNRKMQLLYFPSDIVPAMPNNTVVNTLLFMYGSTGITAATNYTNFTVKVGTTTNTSYSPSTAFYSGLTTVYATGAFTVNSGTAGAWFPIHLTTPFTYDNTKTLIVEISFDSYTNSASTTGITTFTGPNVPGRKLVATTTTATTGNAANNTLQNIGFNIAPPPACNIPTTLTAVPSATTAVLDWAQVGTPVGWQIKYGAPGFNPASAGTAIYTTTHPYTLNAPLTASTNYEYYVRAVCGASDTSEWSLIKRFTTTCNTITAPTVVNGERCGPGTVELQASVASGQHLNWYNINTGGNVLSNSNTFTTGFLNSNATFYVSGSAIPLGPSGNVGIVTLDATKTNGVGLAPQFGLQFNAISAFNLSTVTLYPVSASNAAGTITIGLYNNANTLIQQATFDVVGSPQNLTSLSPYVAELNFAIPQGNNYKLGIVGFTGITACLINGSGPSTVTFPYNLAGAVSITNSLVAGASNTEVYNYFYNWQIGNNNCESSRVPVTATIKALPVINLGNDTTICQGDTITLQAGNTAASYLWKNGQISPEIKIASEDTVWVKVVGANSCENTDTIIIANGIIPTRILPELVTICAGDTAVLNAGATTNSYLWSNNATANIIRVDDAGTYTVRIKSAHGCMIWDSTKVQVNALPISTLANDTTICSSIEMNLTAGDNSNEYLWNNGATTSSITATEDGLYIVRITDANNCKISDSITLTYFEDASVNGFNFVPMFNEELGRVRFNPINPQHVTTYTWDFGDGTALSNDMNPIHDYDTFGKYTVRLTVTSECKDTTYTQEINVGTTGIEDVLENSENIIVYPNPAQHYLIINSKDASSKMVSVVMYNLLGAQVYQNHTLGQEHRINTDQLPSGMYTIKIATEKGWINKKIQIVK
jgi:PKD repeat protein